MTYIYRAFSIWGEKPQALVKCDKCGKTNGIDILPGTTVQRNRVELEAWLLQCGWDVEFTEDGHCLCSQHKEENWPRHGDTLTCAAHGSPSPTTSHGSGRGKVTEPHTSQ